MNLKRNIILGSMLISSLAMANTTANIATSSSAIQSTKEDSQDQKSDKLFYLVEDYSELATAPGFTFGAPSGLVPGSGVGFIAVSGTHNSNDTDGGMALGAGFGDPVNSLGGSAALSLGSIDSRDGGAANRGSANLSVGKSFPKYGFGTAVGVSNIDLWRAHGSDEMTPSYYFAATKLIPNEYAPVILTAGFGSNSYAPISKIKNSKDDLENKWGGFFSGAVYIHPQMSLVLDYTSGMTTFGTSIIPIPRYPVSIGLAAQDLFKENKQQDEIQFLGTLAIGFKF